MNRTLTCINCPLGCELAVDIASDGGVTAVSGNECARGVKYAEAEVIRPERVLTSIVRVTGAGVAMLPVKTSGPIRKDCVATAARALAGISVDAPIAIGDVIVPNICGTGVDVIATRSLPRGNVVTF